jgi:hypothetical protein
MEPYAVSLLRRFNAGESVDELVATEGIPRERIVMRLRAATEFVRIRKAMGLPISLDENPPKLAA